MLTVVGASAAASAGCEMVEHVLPESLYLLGQAEPILDWTAGTALPTKGVHAQLTNFEDREINAVLDMSRSVARFIILLTVLAAIGFFIYAMILLIVSQGESKRLEQAREVILNVFKGLLLGICAYLVLNGIVTVVINAASPDQVVRFWEESQFEGEFNLDSLLARRVELEGVVLMLDSSSSPIVCESPLHQTAIDAGWRWDDEIMLHTAVRADDSPIFRGCYSIR